VTQADLLQAIQAEPHDRSGWLIYSDWLEENGRLHEAEFVRLRERVTCSVERTPAQKRAEQQLQHLLLARVPVPAATRTVWLNSEVPLTFSLISPGSFWMGSPPEESDRYENEGPQHPVTLTRGYYLSIYPITQAQWQTLMGPTLFRFLSPDRPADSISAYDAENFCTRLSERLGREVRLPTEAEWEYACRGGTTTLFYTGNTLRRMNQAGWCSRGATGSARYTKAVGRFLPNPWGLYDMSGNVREWCADDQREYTSEAQINPWGPYSNVHRIVRGGSWYYTAEDARSASRYPRPMEYRLEYYGFRVAMPCE
jgi:uncharacterized protein (TIGR02996 family)